MPARRGRGFALRSPGRNRPVVREGATWSRACRGTAWGRGRAPWRCGRGAGAAFLAATGAGASTALARAALVVSASFSFSLGCRAFADRAAAASVASCCLRARAKGQILRSSQRGQSGSPSTQVSLARSSIRSRNSAPRFLGTARSRTARSSGMLDSEIPSRSSARCVSLSIGMAWPPSACWMTVAVT